jgi:hypothetical protein
MADFNDYEVEQKQARLEYARFAAQRGFRPL